MLTFKVGGTGGKVFFSSKYILRRQIELANYLATQPISLFNDPFSSKGPPGPLPAGFLHLRQRVPHDETIHGDLGELSACFASKALKIILAFKVILVTFSIFYVRRLGMFDIVPV